MQKTKFDSPNSDANALRGGLSCNKKENLPMNSQPALLTMQKTRDQDLNCQCDRRKALETLVEAQLEWESDDDPEP